MRWSKGELSLAKRLLAQGKSFEEISDRMKTRTPGAVAYKAKEFGFITQNELSMWYEERKRLRIGERAKGRYNFRRSVLKRDGHGCVTCEKDKNLHVHHILSSRDSLADGRLVNEPWNGITLCEECHKHIELGKGKLSSEIRRRYVRALLRLGFKANLKYCKSCKRTHVKILNLPPKILKQRS